MKHRKALQNLSILLFWLTAWQLLAMLLAKPYLLPTPIETINALRQLIVTADFWTSTGMTFLRVLSGYIAALVCGICFAVLCHFVVPAEALLAPVRSIIRSTPISSFIILVLLYMTKSTVPAFISFLMVFPMVWENVQEGLRNVDGQLLEMTLIYRFSTWKKITLLYVPSVLPYFAAVCASGLGFAWKSEIAAEIIALPLSSIGFYLHNARISLETPQLFAWTFVVIGLSMAFEKLLLRVVERLKAKGNIK